MQNNGYDHKNVGFFHDIREFPGIPGNCEGFPGISRFPGIQKIREIKDH